MRGVMPSEQEEYLVERLARAVPVRTRRMFGGVGIYSGELFFALIAHDVLYLKVGDRNREDFTHRGMAAFQPFADKPAMQSYFELPADVLADDRRLRAWVAKALDAARAARTRGSTRTRREPDATTRADAGGVRGRAKALEREPGLPFGPKALQRLAEVGVRTRADLERRGAVAVFRAVRARHAKAGTSLLYALEGALLGLASDRLPDVVKQNLRERAGLD